MTVLRWLIGVVFLAVAGIWLWLLLERPVRDRVAAYQRPDYCSVTTLCDVAMAPPIELRVAAAALRGDDRDYRRVLAVAGSAGADRLYPYERVIDPQIDPTDQSLLPGASATNRLFLIRARGGDEALVIVRDTFTQRHAQLLRRGTSLARYRVRTDSDASLDRFALLDPATQMGDTFQLRQAPRSEAFTYVVFAPASPEIRAQWLRSRQSSCGGGPLTSVPAEWVRAYEEACARR